jgi:hypothetical protein
MGPLVSLLPSLSVTRPAAGTASAARCRCTLPSPVVAPRAHHTRAPRPPWRRRHDRARHTARHLHRYRLPRPSHHRCVTTRTVHSSADLALWRWSKPLTPPCRASFSSFLEQMSSALPPPLLPTETRRRPLATPHQPPHRQAKWERAPSSLLSGNSFLAKTPQAGCISTIPPSRWTVTLR